MAALTDATFRAFWRCVDPAHGVDGGGTECWSSSHLSTQDVAEQASRCALGCWCWRHRVLWISAERRAAAFQGVGQNRAHAREEGGVVTIGMEVTSGYDHVELSGYCAGTVRMTPSAARSTASRLNEVAALVESNVLLAPGNVLLDQDNAFYVVKGDGKIWKLDPLGAHYGSADRWRARGRVFRRALTRGGDAYAIEMLL